MTYKKFMSLFLIAGSISSTLCSCAATDSSAVVGYVDECPITMEEFIAQQRERSYRTYGYRRMWLWLKSQNIFCNPKTVLRIMKKYDLMSEIRRRRKWQQMGQQIHKYKICSIGSFPQTDPTANGQQTFSTFTPNRAYCTCP